MYGNMSSFYNPYITAAMPQQVQAVPQQEVVKVNGYNGANSFSMGPNSSALLLDVSGKLVWLVTTDGAGYKTISAYDITPHEDKPLPDYTDLEVRITKLEAILNGTTYDTTAAQRAESKPDITEPRSDKKPYERR